MVHGTSKIIHSDSTLAEKNNIFLFLATILLWCMGLIKVSVGTWYSPNKKYYRFWLHYYYDAWDFENINRQPTPSELDFNFSANAQWRFGIGKAIRTLMKNVQQEKSFIQKWGYPSKVHAQWFKVRQHYYIISIHWKLIQDQGYPYYDLNTFKVHLRPGAPLLLSKYI